MKNIFKILILVFAFSTQLSAQDNAVKDAYKKAVIYEVNLRQYSKEGTFKSFEKELPRLKKMGITIVWFMPIQPIGKKNRKGKLGSYYSISNYTATNPEYGTMEDFKQLVQKSHELGLKVMIDWVANHTSWDHAWVKKHPDFYDKDSTGKMHSPYDWSDVVQLNHKSKAQQTEMINAMQYWVTECNIDGFRCDMAHMAPVDFWVSARKTLDRKKPLLWLGETQDANYYKAFDIIYGWEWLHKMEDFHNGKTTTVGLDSVLQTYYKDYQKGKYRLFFTTNHDENSWSGTEFERLGDQSYKFLKLCSQLPGILLIYSGQEEPLRKRLEFFEKDEIGFRKYADAQWIKAAIDLRNKSKLITPKNKSFLLSLDSYLK
jgi:alpha-amylase